jgi:hypothetical protein
MVGIAPKTVIQGFELTSRAWDFDPYILEDPAGGSSPRDMYRMLDGSRFDRREVLNHRLDKDGILRRGDPMEGCVLAECMAAVPSRYSRSNWLPLTFSIVNRFDEVQAVSFELPVERFRKRVQSRTSREPLFDEPIAKSEESGVWPIPDPFGEEDENRGRSTSRSIRGA